MDLSIVIGNPKPASRTLTIAQAVGDRIVQAYGAKHKLTVDLVDHASEMFEWPNERLNTLNAEIASSDVVIFGSPTYKATYTGLLKAFLDRYPNNGLSGVIAIPIMTARSPKRSSRPIPTSSASRCSTMRLSRPSIPTRMDSSPRKT